MDSDVDFDVDVERMHGVLISGRFHLFQVIHLFQLWVFFKDLEPSTPERIAEDLRTLISQG